MEAATGDAAASESRGMDQQRAGDHVKKAWSELRAFWDEYIDFLESPTESPTKGLGLKEDFSYKDFRESVIAKLGGSDAVSADLRDISEWVGELQKKSPRRANEKAAAQLLKDKASAKLDKKLPKIKEYLQYVVHPKDWSWLCDDSELKPVDLAIMVQFLYSQVPPGKQTAEVGTSLDAYPCLPQPFYGSPLDASLVSIFNNPGYDSRTVDQEPDLAGFELTQKQQLDRFRLDSAKLVRPDLVPCVSDGGYYQKRFNPKSSADYVLQFWSGGEYDWGARRLLAQRVFHVDVCPYQSWDAGSQFMKAIWAANETGLWMPSQEKLLSLLGMLMKRPPRLPEAGAFDASHAHLKEVSGKRLFAVRSFPTKTRSGPTRGTLMLNKINEILGQDTMPSQLTDDDLAQIMRFSSDQNVVCTVNNLVSACGADKDKKLKETELFGIHESEGETTCRLRQLAEWDAALHTSS